MLVLYVLIIAFDVGDLAVQGRMSKDQVLSLLTGVNLALVALGVILKPAGFSWSWGAFLALAAAIVAFVPYGVPLIRAHRRAEPRCVAVTGRGTPGHRDTQALGNGAADHHARAGSRSRW